MMSRLRLPRRLNHRQRNRAVYFLPAFLLLSLPHLPAIAQGDEAHPRVHLSQQSVEPSAATNPAISFRRPLRVTNVRIPNSWQYRASDYFFTLDFPADAVEPLEKLVFEQIEGADYPHYNPDSSYAFTAGDRNAQQPLSQVENNTDDRTITVKFDPPVEPGGQLTIALRSRRNPRDGIYVYRLTAYPVGASEGQYAGITRLNFYAPTRRRFRWR
ncbi:MAG: DUF2808 domain-containing protein [Phormidesmis sp.]